MRGERIKEGIATLRGVLILDLAALLLLIAWMFEHADTSRGTVVNTVAACAGVALLLAVILGIRLVSLIRRLEDEPP